MRDVAIAWQLYVLTGSPLSLGLLGAFRAVPMIAFALWGGALADALDRRRVLLVTQSALTLTSATLAWLAFTGSATPATLYALVAASSVATAFDNPARQSLVVNLLPREDLANGLTLGIFGWQVATVVGPALGGVLLASLGIEAIYLIDTVSFAGVLGALLVVRPRAQERDERALPKSVSLRAIGEGYRFLRTKPVLVWLMLIDFFATFFAGAMLLMPIYADQILGVGTEGLGVLTSAPAVGSLVASAFLATRAPIVKQGPVVLVAVAIYGVSMAAFGLSTSFVLSLALLAIAGAADTVSTVIRQVVRQTMTPDALRGRMTSINMIFFMGGPQLGEVEAGAVAEATSPPVSVVSGGLACVLVAVLAALFVPALRSLREEERPRRLDA